MKWWVLLALVAAPAYAQQDTPWRLAPDGTIVGAPNKATLDIDFDPDPGWFGNPVRDVAVRIDDRELRLPLCLTTLLKSRSRDDVWVGGSASQLRVEFREPGEAEEGVQFLFDLRTAALLDARKIDEKRNWLLRKHVSERDIDVATECGGEPVARPVADTP